MSRAMRIASLLPSATEIVFALGLADRLVAVTHECDYPVAANDKPRATKNLLPPSFSSSEIDRAVVESTVSVHSVYELDVDLLVSLKPDLIITQDVCRVCAVPRSSVAEAAERLGGARVLSLDPATIDDVMENIDEVGTATGCPAAGRELTASLRSRLAAVSDGVAGRQRPRVACLEWFDPIFAAGHWVPEQVRMAGGREVLGHEASPSTVVDWETVVALAPEVLVLMPCGFNAAEAADRLSELSSRPGWSSLPAVEEGRVFAVDASAYFSRPGPRLVDGVELLAQILHPDRPGTKRPSAAKESPASDLAGRVIRLAG